MTRYIDKEKAQIFLRTECLAKYPASFANGLFAAADQLSKLPAADVVEVVRCKDCKLWTGKDYDGCCIKNALATRYANDFCSYGERRKA